MGDRTKIADAQIAAFKAAWHKADAEGRAGERVRDGLAAAGVLRADPDTSNELFTEARRLLDAATTAPRSHRCPDGMVDDVISWACQHCGEWQRDYGPQTDCAAAPEPTMVHAPSRLIAALLAERDAERAARERAEAEARQLREAIETAESVGVDYCTLHHGIRNEDEHSCDFRDDDQESGDDGEPRECVLVDLIQRPSLDAVAEGAEDRGQS